MPNENLPVIKCEEAIKLRRSQESSRSLLELRKRFLSRNKIFGVSNENPKLNNSPTSNSCPNWNFSPSTSNLKSRRIFPSSIPLVGVGLSRTAPTSLLRAGPGRKEESTSTPIPFPKESTTPQRTFIAPNKRKESNSTERKLVVNEGVDFVNLWLSPTHYSTGTVKRRPLKNPCSISKSLNDTILIGFPQENYSLTTNNPLFSCFQENYLWTVKEQISRPPASHTHIQDMVNGLFSKQNLPSPSDKPSNKNQKSSDLRKQALRTFNSQSKVLLNGKVSKTKPKRIKNWKPDSKTLSKCTRNSICSTKIDIKSFTSSCRDEKTLGIFHGQTDSGKKVMGLGVGIGDSYKSDSSNLTSIFLEKKAEKATLRLQHSDLSGENDVRPAKNTSRPKTMAWNTPEKSYSERSRLKYGTRSLPNLFSSKDPIRILPPYPEDIFSFPLLISSSSSHNHISSQPNEQLDSNALLQNEPEDGQSQCPSNFMLPKCGEVSEMQKRHSLNGTKETRNVLAQVNSNPYPYSPSTLYFAMLNLNEGTGFTKKIYTDWANHYLEKAKCKRSVQDLQVDVTDGVILAEVVEAVTSQKVPDIIRKPKNASQMLDNIQSCLSFLSGIGVNLDGINGRDIRDGQLKSILSLFFQLSRYKQQQKQQDRDRHSLLKQNGDNMHGAGVKTFGYKSPQTDLAKLPSSLQWKSNCGGSNIPLPGAVASQSNSSQLLTPKRVQSNTNTSEIKQMKLNAQGNGTTFLHPNASGSVNSGSSSRSTSPSGVTGIPQSFIPTPRTSIPSGPSSARTSIHEKNISVKIPSGQTPQGKSSSRVQNPNNGSSGNNFGVNGKTNSSMLEKFKFFKDKDKSGKVKGSTGSKRTSSSSGFSSARSERSDSSVSLCNESKVDVVEGLCGRGFNNPLGTKEETDPVIEHSDTQNQSITSSAPFPLSTPNFGIKGFKQKLGKAISIKDAKNSHGSPKLQKREVLLASNEQLHLKNPSTRTSLSKIQSQNPQKSDLLHATQNPESSLKKNSIGSNAADRQLSGGKSDSSKLRTPSRNSDNSGTILSSCDQNTPSTGNQSFLRLPKTNNPNNRDSRNRFSGTGIPTRNSAISPNSQSSSRDELSVSANQQEMTSASNTTTMLGSEANNVNTGIPKPTAAVKGTSKSFNNNSFPKEMIPTMSESHNPNQKSAMLSKPLQLQPVHRTIPKCPAINGENEGTLGNNKNENISVALVQPMPPDPLQQTLTPQTNSFSSNDSSLTQSNNSNGSESSVITLGSKLDSQRDDYVNKKQSVENVNEEKYSVTNGKCSSANKSVNGQGPHKTIEDVIVECDEDEIMLTVTPMEPILRSSPYGYMKSPPGSGLLSPRSTGSNSIQNGRLGLELRGGNNGNRQLFSPSNYSDPGRVVNRNHNNSSRKYGISTQYTSNMGDYDYPDIENLDVSGTGYLSDGDLLSSTNNGNRLTDISGYLSESGTGNYTRKLNQYSRNTDGNIVAKNNKNNMITEDRNGFDVDAGRGRPDLLEALPSNSNSSKLCSVRVVEGKGSKRFDDSSSLSSGISDLNEIPTDLTSSSVNSEVSSPYASLQRLGDSSSLRKKKEPIDPQSIIYRVVGCRSGSNRRQVDSFASKTPGDSSGSQDPIHGVVSLKDKTDSLSNLRKISLDLKGNGQSGSFGQLNINNGPNTLSHSSLQSGKSGKQINSQETNKKPSIMGMRNEYTGRDSGENGLLEDGTPRNRNGQLSSNNEMSLKKSSSQSTPSVKNVGSPVAFGYIRRSTGCGSSGGNGVSMTKYSIPIPGSGSSKGQDEYKVAAHISLMPKSQYALHGEDMQHGIHYIPASSPNNPGLHIGKTRTKVKVSGGTQTTSDLHEISRNPQYHQSLPQQHPNNPQRHNSTSDVEYAASTCSRNSTTYSAPYKSLSLTAPTAAQLSRSLRERILGSNSLPKGTTSAEYAALLATMYQHQQNSQIYGTPNASRERMARYNKFPMHDGTLSDSGGYGNYADIQAYGNLNSANTPGNAPYPWIRHSTGYASSITSAPTRLGNGGSMTEAESMESLSSTSSFALQVQREVRSSTLASAKSATNTAQQNGEGSPPRSPRLNRSNSISHFRERTFPRSTKSEKLYPSMLQRSEEVVSHYAGHIGGPTINPGPTSPMAGNNNRHGGLVLGAYTGTLAGNQSGRLSMSPYSGYLNKMVTKEDEINGSALSLVSTASSIYNSQEEKHSYELRKLKRELMENQEKVQTLTNQLSTNAHVVAAFEQSLANMTHRLQNLTATAEKKDSELVELRRTIEHLRREGIEAGIGIGHTKSEFSRDSSPIARQLSADSVSSINSISSACSGTSHTHSHASSPAAHMQPLGSPHHHHASLPTPDSPNSKKKNAKNKGWLRSSFTKAFTRSKSKTRNGSGNDGHGDELNSRPTLSINEYGHQSSNGNSEASGAKDFESFGPTSPVLASPHGCSSSSGHGSGNGCGSSTGSHSPRSNGIMKGSTSSSALGEETHPVKLKSVDDLKKQLREKEMVLTDIRLEALTSAHQLESLKETVNKMRNEMLSLKQDNERLQRMVTSRSLNSSQTSLQTNGIDTFDRRLSATEFPQSNVIDPMLTDPSEKEGKRIIVTVFLGCHGDYARYVKPGQEMSCPISECAIGTVSVSTRTKWDLLDSVVRRTFKDYVMRVDPVSNLGLSADSITCYNVGEVFRSKELDLPDLLPCGYLVGDVNKIRICLKGALTNSSVDSLAFETLTPKSVLHRYISLLSDYGRLVFCGPSGTGKSYLARKLGEFLVARTGKDPSPEAIATFSVDHKNSKELRQYLCNLAEQCENGSMDLPSVIILDNLHQVSSFGEVFNGFLSSNSNCAKPIMIGTMTQSSNSTVNLQLHHSFRWVLLGNNTEPTKGLLSRYLNRRLIESDVQNGNKNIELARIMEWIPETYSHINRFLEMYNAPEVTIGPKLFLFCPTDVGSSQIWFNDLWHYKIVPYLIEAVKEGFQLYGKKHGQWEDPAEFVIQTYPWAGFNNKLTSNTTPVLRIRAEDVGYDSKSGSNGSAKLFKGNETDGADPLLNMLMRLQEAANYSGGMDSSDSTSLDSHLSKDFTATA